MHLHCVSEPLQAACNFSSRKAGRPDGQLCPAIAAAALVKSRRSRLFIVNLGKFRDIFRTKIKNPESLSGLNQTRSSSTLLNIFTSNGVATTDRFNGVGQFRRFGPACVAPAIAVHAVQNRISPLSNGQVEAHQQSTSRGTEQSCCY